MTATTPEEEKPAPQTNRATRRGKGRTFTVADFRRMQADSIKYRLFAKAEDGKQKDK